LINWIVLRLHLRKLSTLYDKRIARVERLTRVIRYVQFLTLSMLFVISWIVLVMNFRVRQHRTRMAQLLTCPQ